MGEKGETGNISGRTHVVALLGDPIAHSLSPAIHNLSFRLLGIDAAYVAFRVGKDGMAAAAQAMRALDGWDGANLTMPCKQAVIPHLDALDAAARLIGAVNVVSKAPDGTLCGHNTDGLGCTQNMRKHGVAVAGADITLIGAGGTASAILAQAALEGAASVRVFSRRSASFERMQDLIARVAAEEASSCALSIEDIADGPKLADAVAASDAVVNASPIGMGDAAGQVPIDPAALRPGTAVVECPYNPRTTRLMREAAARGCATLDGVGMLVEQAAAGERIWYGVDMPADAVARALF